MVLGVGYVAEHPEVEEALKRKGVYEIDEEHLLQSFEASMSAQVCAAGIHQIVVGMNPAKLQKSIKASETTDGLLAFPFYPALDPFIKPRGQS